MFSHKVVGQLSRSEESMSRQIKAIEWDADKIVLLDQTLLPGVEKYLEIRTIAELVGAIQRLVVRGAPALGVAGALG